MKLFLAGLTAALLAQTALPAAAQGLQTEGAVETIIDAPVATEEKPVAAENDRITAAIAKGEANAEEIRKRSQVDKVDIVVVPGLADANSPLGKTIADHRESINALRAEIEGSAIFFHAVDSKDILLRDVVAVELGERNEVTIFVAAPAADATATGAITEDP